MTSNVNVSPLPLHPQPKSALTMRLPVTSRIQVLKRRSRSLSSESSSFSLPFKKRRFVVISTNNDDDHHQQEVNYRSFSAPLGLSPYRNLSSSLSEQDDREKDVVTTPPPGIANAGVGVSALIGEGIACITPVPNALKECRMSLIPKEIPRLLMCVKTKLEDGGDRGGKGKTILSASPSIPVPQPMQTRRSSRNSTTPGGVPIAGLETNHQPKRISYPKLDSPLPNGCHGKTSRTQSFCRRAPNYNGSNFCKLHYFDPRYTDAISTSTSTSTSTTSTSTSSTSGEVNKMCQKTPEIAVLISENLNQSISPVRNTKETIRSKKANDEAESVSSKKPTSNPKQKFAPRDKLFRGPTGNSAGEESSEVEVRCVAISTRGKRCCYAAVACNGDEYCHRHSSLFTTSDTKENALDSKNQGNDDSNENSIQERSSTEIFDSENGSAPRRNRSLATSQKPPLTGLSDPRAPKALSDLSTDLWQNRRVMIAKGPHESRIGTVVRWRNGWVTVELSEQQENQKNTTSKGKNDRGKSKYPAFHNRRSYELTLV